MLGASDLSDSSARNSLTIRGAPPTLRASVLLLFDKGNHRFSGAAAPPPTPAAARAGRPTKSRSKKQGSRGVQPLRALDAHAVEGFWLFPPEQQAALRRRSSRCRHANPRTTPNERSACESPHRLGPMDVSPKRRAIQNASDRKSI